MTCLSARHASFDRTSVFFWTSNWIFPASLVSRPLAKGNEDSGFEVALVRTSPYHIIMTGNFKVKYMVVSVYQQPGSNFSSIFHKQ